MRELSIASAASITSREIAELVEKRHDNVRVTIERLRAERDALAQDAARYRWMRFRISAHGVCDGWEFGFPTYRSLPAPPLAMRSPDLGLDAAIDAAIAAADAPPQGEEAP